MMQGKGLLATEAPITVPLVRADGCVPLVDSVFLEFEDAAGRFRLLDEVAPDAEYAVIVTQPGGLLRYRLGDRVRVTRPVSRRPAAAVRRARRCRVRLGRREAR